MPAACRCVQDRNRPGPSWSQGNNCCGFSAAKKFFPVKIFSPHTLVAAPLHRQDHLTTVRTCFNLGSVPHCVACIPMTLVCRSCGIGGCPEPSSPTIFVKNISRAFIPVSGSVPGAAFIERISSLLDALPSHRHYCPSCLAARFDQFATLTAASARRCHHSQPCTGSSFNRFRTACQTQGVGDLLSGLFSVKGSVAFNKTESVVRGVSNSRIRRRHCRRKAFRRIRTPPILTIWALGEKKKKKKEKHQRKACTHHGHGQNVRLHRVSNSVVQSRTQWLQRTISVDHKALLPQWRLQQQAAAAAPAPSAPNRPIRCSRRSTCPSKGPPHRQAAFTPRPKYDALRPPESASQESELSAE